MTADRPLSAYQKPISASFYALVSSSLINFHSYPNAVARETEPLQVDKTLETCTGGVVYQLT